MAILFQVTCLILLLGMIYGRRFPSFFNGPFPSTSFDDSFDDDDWFPSSEFDDINKMEEESQQEFQKIDDFSAALDKANNDEMVKMKTKLDAVPAVCTTTENLPTTNTSRATKTTTCVKELINGTMKYIYTEVKVTDDQGKIISQNSGYKSFTFNQFNEITSSNTTG